MADIYDINAAIQKPNMLAAVQQGYGFGTQQRQVREEEQRQNRLRGLAPGILAGDPAAFNEAAAIDPVAATQTQQAGDSQLRRLKGFIDYVDQARSTGNIQAVNAALRQGAPFLSQITGGKPPPTEWTPDMDAGWEQLKAKVSVLPMEQSAVPAGFQEAHMTALAAGYQPGSPEYQKFMRVRGGIDPRAAPPGFAFVEEYDPATGQTSKRLVQTRGFQDGATAPATMPAPAASEPVRQFEVTPGPGGMPTDPLEQEAARRAMTEGGSFYVSGDRVVPGQSPGLVPPPASAAPRQRTMADTPINEIGGGPVAPLPGSGRFVTGPTNEQAAEQKRREAAATAQGSREGERAFGPDFENEKAFRMEYRNAVAPSQEVVQQYQRVEGAASNPSAAGDLSMIFAYMKMLDPGSVVREGEFANAQNAAGVPDQLVNLYNRAISGQRLNPAQRQDFLRQAATLRDQAQRRIDEAEAYYARIAPEYGIDPRRIIRGSSDTPAGGQTYTPGQVIEINGKRYRVVGGDPNDPDVEEL